MSKHVKIRLPKRTINTLRDLSHSHITPRPIPRLVNACLKQTRGVDCLELAPIPRNDSERWDLWIDEEFFELTPTEIRARVAHALIGIEAKMVPDQIKINRGQYEF